MRRQPGINGELRLATSQLKSAGPLICSHSLFLIRNSREGKQADQQPAVGTRRGYGAQAPTPDALRCDEHIPWQEVEAFATGKTHKFRVKTPGPLLWKKAGADLPIRLVVVAPVGYRLRKGSKLLYRQPAYLICTDPDMPFQEILQYYHWPWDLKVNHRDEKQIIGVGEAQVRSARSVEGQRHDRKAHCHVACSCPSLADLQARLSNPMPRITSSGTHVGPRLFARLRRLFGLGHRTPHDSTEKNITSRRGEWGRGGDAKC